LKQRSSLRQRSCFGENVRKLSNSIMDVTQVTLQETSTVMLINLLYQIHQLSLDLSVLPFHLGCLAQVVTGTRTMTCVINPEDVIINSGQLQSQPDAFTVWAPSMTFVK
jgi:hypothetical protein